jgi:hypothetical protein
MAVVNIETVKMIIAGSLAEIRTRAAEAMDIVHPVRQIGEKT